MVLHRRNWSTKDEFIASATSAKSRPFDRGRRDRRKKSHCQSRSQIQPRRVHTRQQERDSGTYFDIGSDGEDLEDRVLSTNNTPPGSHAGDCQVHFFRLPDSSFEFGIPARKGVHLLSLSSPLR